MNHFLYKHQGFTLIELMIGILIFSIGMTGIYALMQMATISSSQVRSEIIAANLLREQVELVKNLRDTNIRNYLPWDSVPQGSITHPTFMSGYYIIENDFTEKSIDPTSGRITKSPVYLRDITFTSTDIQSRYEVTRLFIDTYGRYTHMTTGSGAAFASYIRVTPLEIPTLPTLLKVEILSSAGILRPQAYKLEGRVIVSSPKYKEYELVTIISDWKK